MRLPGFIGPSYTPQSQLADIERSVNLYPEVVESQHGKSTATLYGTPGRSLFATLTQIPVRALFAQDGRMFAVGGSRFFEVFATGAIVNRGAVAMAGVHATICSNGSGGHQLFIVSGGAGYIFDLNTNTLTQITSPGFPLHASMGAFLDGYFIVLVSDSNQFQLSDLEDGLTWSGIDVAQRTSGSDLLQTIVVDHRQLWLIGSRSTEVWYNSGAASFPFQPIPGAFLERGAIRWTACRLDNTIVFVGQDSHGSAMAFRATEFVPHRISTHAVEYAWSQYSTIQDAESWTYQEQGHSFWVVNFPTAQKTWVFDAANNFWHERDYWNAATGLTECDRPGCHAFEWDRHLVGDRVTGAIYTQSLSLVDHAGVPRRCRRRCPHVSAEANWMFYSRFQLDADVGLGLSQTTAAAVAALAAAAAANDMLTTYQQEIVQWTGDGDAAPRLIPTSFALNTGVVAVWIFPQTVRAPLFRHSAMTGTQLVGTSAALSTTGGILSLAAGGFTVGPDDIPIGAYANELNRPYTAIVLRDSSVANEHLRVGSYAGFGNHARQITVTQGLTAIGVNTLVAGEVGASFLHLGVTYRIASWTSATVAELDIPWVPAGVDVLQPITILGDDRIIPIGNTNLTTNPTSAVWVFGRGVAFRSNDYLGDSSTSLALEAKTTTDQIQGFTSLGFIVGTDNNVNNIAATYYWMALSFTATQIANAFFQTFKVAGSVAGATVTGLGFTPTFAVVREYGAGALGGQWRGPRHTGTTCSALMDEAPNAAGGIEAFGDGTISLGADVAPAAATTYGWAWLSSYNVSAATRTAAIAAAQLLVDESVTRAPKVILRWSDDGGNTWSSDYMMALGKAGKYLTRAIWNRLGRSRDRVFEVEIDDATPVRLIDAFVSIARGTS